MIKTNTIKLDFANFILYFLDYFYFLLSKIIIQRNLESVFII